MTAASYPAASASLPGDPADDALFAAMAIVIEAGYRRRARQVPRRGPSARSQST
jgi:hypothetical protein